MGAAIARCCLQGAVKDLALAGGVDAPSHPGQGKDLGALAGVEPAGVALTDHLDAVLSELDVAIDFSVPHATVQNAARLAGQGKPLVVGTTGLTADQAAALEQAAERCPLIIAANMSLGVNLLLKLAEQAAASLRGKGYDVEIIERHHRRKKDAPSGTALALGEAVARGLDCRLDDTAVHGRAGMVGERTDDEIGFHAVRGGDIVGDHTVVYAANGELIELSHRATTRDTFALGALRAASWIVGKPPGRYTMRDVLGLG